MVHNDIKICLYVLNQRLEYGTATGHVARRRRSHAPAPTPLLRQAELTVSELIEIVGQSQPRVSRHLKLLCGAGLIERFKEGSWVFYRATTMGEVRRLVPRCRSWRVDRRLI